MKNLFIPYELAVIAKEKGFNEPCLAHYISKNHIEAYGRNGLDFLSLSNENNIKNSFCTAPLYQQIVDWFREKHQIDIAYKLTGANHRFCWSKNESKPIEFTKGDLGGYYGAFNKAIEEAFKLI